MLKFKGRSPNYNFEITQRHSRMLQILDNDANLIMVTSIRKIEDSNTWIHDFQILFFNQTNLEYFAPESCYVKLPFKESGYSYGNYLKYNNSQFLIYFTDLRELVIYRFDCDSKQIQKTYEKKAKQIQFDGIYIFELEENGYLYRIDVTKSWDNFIRVPCFKGLKNFTTKYVDQSGSSLLKVTGFDGGEQIVTIPDQNRVFYKSRDLNYYQLRDYQIPKSRFLFGAFQFCWWPNIQTTMIVDQKVDDIRWWHGNSWLVYTGNIRNNKVSIVTTLTDNFIIMMRPRTKTLRRLKPQMVAGCSSIQDTIQFRYLLWVYRESCDSQQESEADIQDITTAKFQKISYTGEKEVHGKWIFVLGQDMQVLYLEDKK